MARVLVVDDSATDRLIIAAGHGRNGVCLSAATGQAVTHAGSLQCMHCRLT